MFRNSSAERHYLDVWSQSTTILSENVPGSNVPH